MQTFSTGLHRQENKQSNGYSLVGAISYSNDVTAQISVSLEAQQYGVSIDSQQPVVGTFISSHRAIQAFRPVTQINTAAVHPDQAYGTYHSEAVQRFSGNNGQGTMFRLKETLVSLAMFGAQTDLSDGDKYAVEYFKGFVDVLRIMLPESLEFKNLSIRVADVVLETATGSFVIDAASGGVTSVIDMAWQIYSFSKTTQAASALNFTVVLDEPENHLHPSMQRVLLANLLLAFPRAQFIVATHSPFMVSSVKESLVYALRYVPVELENPSNDKEEDNLAKLVVSEKLDVINRAGSSAEILRDVLGVPVTIPLWVEDQLNLLVNEYRYKELDRDSLSELRSRMIQLGFGEMYPTVLAGVVEKK